LTVYEQEAARPLWPTLSAGLVEDTLWEPGVLVSSKPEPESGVARPEEGAGSAAVQWTECGLFSRTGALGQSEKDAVGDCQSTLPLTVVFSDVFPAWSLAVPSAENAPVPVGTFEAPNVT
jgi:hypothetical protein